jgi:hypothetical protein
MIMILQKKKWQKKIKKNLLQRRALTKRESTTFKPGFQKKTPKEKSINRLT